MRRLVLKLSQWAISLGVLYLVWVEVLVPHTSRAFMAPPLPVWHFFQTLWKSGTLWNMIGGTLSEAGIGLLIGVGAGLFLAIGVALSHKLVSEVIEPAVAALYAMPKFALAPVLFITLGVGATTREFFIAIAIVAIVFINVSTGIKTIDQNLVYALKLMGMNRRQMATKLLLRHTVNSLMVALTFALPYALMVAIGAEMLFGSQTGIGGQLQIIAGEFNAAGVIADLAVATAIAVLATELSTWLSARLISAEP